MRVTFTCEKCGVEFADYTQTGIPQGWRVTAPDFDCPNCSKLRYGPLTEEMVAEALWEAMRKDDPYVSAWAARGDNPVLDEDFNREARFVLRLLQTWDATAEIPRRECYADDWHAKLLELARQK